MNKETIKVIFTFFLLIFLLLFGFNLLKDIKENYKIYYKIRNKLESKAGPTKKLNGESFIGDTFIDFTLEDLHGQIWRLNNSKALLKVIIIFNLDNCPSCLQEYILWKKIDRIFGDNEVFILGISNSPDISGLLTFIKNRGIKFPILIDPSDSIRQKMEFKHSPLRITLDSKNKIIDVSIPSSEYSKQKNYNEI
ncbi:MAG: redoxin domain-containing protein [Acidobacteriota bacterium]